jgi:hypothetical protein
MRRITFVLTMATVAMAAIATIAPQAAADQTYHSTHVQLLPVGNASLRSGFVENIHPNGPNVFAHEQYVLNGAEPNTTYEVMLSISVGDPTCATTSFTLATATFTTNAAGNGVADHVFTPADAAGLRGLLLGGRWQLVADGTVEYTSDCESVQLD